MKTGQKNIQTVMVYKDALTEKKSEGLAIVLKGRAILNAGMPGLEYRRVHFAHDDEHYDVDRWIRTKAIKVMTRKQFNCVCLAAMKKTNDKITYDWTEREQTEASNKQAHADQLRETMEDR